MSRPGRNQQRGLLVLDALVWLGAFLGVIWIASYIIAEIRTQTFAENSGKYAAQVAVAVRALIAAEGATAVTYAAAPNGTDGTVWLRSSADCPTEAGATALNSYLPICGFPEEDPNFGMEINTVITQAAPGDPVFGTITLGPLPPPYDDRYDLLQVMRRAAANAEPAATAASSGTFISVVNEADPATTTAAAAAAGTGSPTLNLEINVSNISALAEPYIRADGQRAWNVGVTQDVSNSNFIQVESIARDGAALAAGDVEMARFVDSDDNLSLLDPDGESALNIVDITQIKNDPLLDLDGDGTGERFLSNSIIYERGVVNQGGTVNKPNCPNGTPEIHGSIASIIATDNPAGGGGSYADPKNLKGFAVYHDSAAETGSTWTVYALAFVDDSSAGYELVPPNGGLARIQYYTMCG